MLEVLSRMMNDAERTLLAEDVDDTTPFVTLRDTLEWSCVWCAALGICGLLVVAMIAFKINPIVGGVLGGPVALFAIVCLYAIIQLWSSYFHWSRIHRHFRHDDVPEIQRALEDGLVTVKRVSANAVIEIVEFEDEGGGYIFDLGNNHVLFLKGQRFFPVNEEMLWPNSEFEIVRTNIGNRWVGIFCYGSELTPIRTLQTSDCREDIVWTEHEEVVHTDLDSFASSLSAA